MVGRECTYALGSIAIEECLVTLKELRQDKERVVRERCEVALAHEKSAEFQYANTLCQVNTAKPQTCAEG